MPRPSITVFAPGRVNLIGDHTDYAGGFALPMAIDLGTTVTAQRGGDRVILESDQMPGVAEVPLDAADPVAVEPEWARFVAAVVAEVRPSHGLAGRITSTLPVGAGLSSSASLTVAVALALGFDGPARDLASLAQRAEQAATGLPCGLLDQLSVTLAEPGHALRIDFATLDVQSVPFPPDVEAWVVHSGQPRALADSAYADRAAAVARAAQEVGPLGRATLADLGAIADETTRRRARHVVTENARVQEMAAALAGGDRQAIGEAMAASHASLAGDYDVSTPALDHTVADLVATPGVIGARLTGAGFGGCAVALVEAGTPLIESRPAWRVRPWGPASVTFG